MTGLRAWFVWVVSQVFVIIVTDLGVDALSQLGTWIVVLAAPLVLRLVAPILGAAWAALGDAWDWVERVGWPTRPSPRSRFAVEAVSLAAVLAGPRRNMRDVWLADLAGVPEEGIVLTWVQQRRLARGFVVAGLRMRLHDLCSPLWRPVDWLLTTDSRTNTVTAATVGALVIYIARQDGLHTLLTEGWGWCAGCGGSLYLLFRWLRRIRGIEIARPAGSSQTGGDEL